MKSSSQIKASIALSSVVLISGCSLDAYIDKVKNFIYIQSPSLEAENVCMGFHYHKANSLPDNLKADFEGKISYFYWFGSEESKKSDKAYQNVSSIFEGDVIQRFPAINDDKWVDSANWSMALAEMGIANNPSIINLSYSYFLNDLDIDQFNKNLTSEGYSHQVFSEIRFSNEYSEKFFRLGDITYYSGVEKIPAIVVGSDYIVYPSDFNDMRDAWMTANYLYKNESGLSSSCQKPEQK